MLNFVGGIVLFGGQAYLPQEVIQLFTSDEVMAGEYNIPFNAMSVGGRIVNAVALGITKEAKWTGVTAFFMLFAGNCLMLVMRPNINFAAWFFPTALLGTAVGIQASLLIVVVSVCTPNHLIASAVSVTSSARALGGSIGTVIFSVIFASKLENFIPDELSKDAIQAGLPSSSMTTFLQALLSGRKTVIMDVPGVNPSIITAAEHGVAKAYSHGFKFV